MPKGALKSKALEAELATTRQQLNAQAQELAAQQGKTLAAENAVDALQSELRQQEAIGAAAAPFATTNAGASSDARDYEIEVLKLELRRMQDMVAVHDVTDLVAENNSLRKEVADLHAENLTLSKHATEHTDAARRDVGQVQIMLETQYRRSLKDAEQRVKEQLYSEMSDNQKDMVQRHRDLMASVKVMKTHNNLMEGRLEKTQMDYNESKIQADIASGMQDLQSKEIVVLRHRLNATLERAHTLENILLSTYKAHPHLVDWALSAKNDFVSIAADTQSVLKGGTDKAGGAADSALAEAQAEVKRLREQRDLWKTRAQRMKGVFAGMQHDLHVMTQIAQTALPNGGGFQEDKSIWSDAPATGSVDTFLEDSRALVDDRKGTEAPSLHTPAELEELDRELQGLDATLRSPEGSPSTDVQRERVDEAENNKASPVRPAAAADSDINFMPKLPPVRTFVRTTAGREDKPQPSATLEWKPSKPAKSAMKSGLNKSGENQGKTQGAKKRTVCKEPEPNASGSQTRGSKGVTLHESQNITHMILSGTTTLPRGNSNADDMKGTAKQLAIDDDGAFNNVEHVPSLMECMAQGSQAPPPVVVAVAAPVGLGTTRRRGSAVVAKSTRHSFMLDEPTRQLIEGLTSEELLDVNVVDHPPICFFAAKGRLSQMETSDSKSTPVVSLFSAYDDDGDDDDTMPHVSRLRDVQTDGLTFSGPPGAPGNDDDDAARDDLSNRLFGTVLPASGANAAGDNDDDAAREALSDRIFGTSPPGFDSLDEDAAREALSDRLFGGSLPAITSHDDMDDDEAAREALSDRLFGTAGPASNGYGGDFQEERAQQDLADHMFGNGVAGHSAEDRDDEQDERDALTERLFGSMAGAQAPGPDGEEEDGEDREQARDALTQRMFGVTAAAREPQDQDEIEADEREALTQRLFGGVPVEASTLSDAEQEQEEQEEAEAGGSDLFRRTFGATFAKLPIGNGGHETPTTDISEKISAYPKRMSMGNTMPAGSSAKIPALYDADLDDFDQTLSQVEELAGKINLHTRQFSPSQHSANNAFSRGDQQAAPGAVNRSQTSPELGNARGAVCCSLDCFTAEAVQLELVLCDFLTMLGGTAIDLRHVAVALGLCLVTCA